MIHNSFFENRVPYIKSCSLNRDTFLTCVASLGLLQLVECRNERSRNVFEQPPNNKNTKIKFETTKLKNKNVNNL